MGGPVRDPSSMIRHVICPSFRISPSFAGTKLMGRRGIFMLARAWRASSSIVTIRVVSRFAGRVSEVLDWETVGWK